MSKVFRWLVSNLGLIVISLFLAILAWAVAVEEENPTSERRFPSAVAVDISQPPEGMIAYGETDVEAYVTLKAPESVWGILQEEDIHAEVDLSGLEEGTHQLPIDVQVDRSPVAIRGVDPEAVTIHLEPVRVISLPVSVRIQGSTALGYVARSPQVQPLTVTARGPASLVTQAVEARVAVSVEGARADIRQEFELEPRDSHGEVVPHLMLEPAEVSVQVPVEQLSGFRDLSVMALLEGQAAPGYRISSITVDPPVVTVFGPPDVIEGIPGYIQTTPLNIEGAQEDIEIELPLTVPDGVSLTGMQDPLVDVRVSIVPQEGSLTLERPVEIQGLTEMTATVAPETVEVILTGPQPVLDSLEEEDVQVFVDVFGLSPGTHSVEPQVAVAPSDDVSALVLPSSVQVEILPLETITPTPGPSGG